MFLLLVFALGWAIYGPVHAFDFINFDDDSYLEYNPWLKRGLTWQSLEWACVANLLQFSPHAEYWSPLTLLSRLADAQFFGINPGAFHVTSACIHLLNATLLCAALSKLTGSWRRSAVVSLLFLVHPLNVEPVCWLSARKDLLSATFTFATLLCYSHYARRPNLARYSLLLLAFIAALMAKPMAVTVPFILLALDWWPLNRWRQASQSASARWSLLLEKVPLLLLAGAGALLAIKSQHDWGAIQSASEFPFQTRLNNALVSYVTYLRRIFWPTDLAVFYPHPGRSLPAWEGVAAAVLLCGVTALLAKFHRKAPFALPGWLWFGIGLGPVIGLVQIGGQAMADRYAYVPIVGILIVAVWAGAKVAKKHRTVAAGITAFAMAALIFVSVRQTLTWRNSETVFQRDLAVTQNNDLATLNLGCVHFKRGEYGEAAAFYRKSLAMKPGQARVWNNLAAAEEKMGHEVEAIEDYGRSLEMNPNDPKSLLYLGSILEQRGDDRAAERLFLQAHEVAEGWREPYVRLAALFERNGRLREAATVWSSYLSIEPGDEASKIGLKRDGGP